MLDFMRILFCLGFVVVAVIAEAETQDDNLAKRVSHQTHIPGDKSPGRKFILHLRPHGDEQTKQRKMLPLKREDTAVDDLFASRFGKEDEDAAESTWSAWRMGREADTVDTTKRVKDAESAWSVWRMGRETDGTTTVKDATTRERDASIPSHPRYQVFRSGREAEKSLPMSRAFGGKRDSPGDAPIPYYYSFNNEGKDFSWNIFGRKRAAESDLPMSRFVDGRKRDLPMGRTFSKRKSNRMFSRADVPFFVKRGSNLPMNRMFSRSAVPYFGEGKRESNHLPMGIFSREKTNADVPFYVKRASSLPLGHMFSKRANFLNNRLPMQLGFKRASNLPMTRMFSKRASLPMLLGVVKKEHGGFARAPEYNWGPASLKYHRRSLLPMIMHERKRRFNGFRPVVSGIINNDRNRKLKNNVNDFHVKKL
uniref:Uncharacterized protein n=1 Tax=Clytia hemisphaerica TaxID=252671 RepID=A0A7M5WML7_9CNID